MSTNTLKTFLCCILQKEKYIINMHVHVYKTQKAKMSRSFKIIYLLIIQTVKQHACPSLWFALHFAYLHMVLSDMCVSQKKKNLSPIFFSSSQPKMSQPTLQVKCF